MKASKKKMKVSQFESKDLGDTLKKFKSAGRWIRPKTKPTSIALPEETIQILREKASRKGIGYQTLLKMIVQEHLSEY
jgi:predicted DNA binding CopG/RHH family protein